MMKKPLMICVIIIGVAGPAGAAPTTLITFDEFPNGTLIDTQYASQGVQFTPGDVTLNLPQIDGDGFMPDSPVLRPTGEPGLYDYRGDFWIHFITPAVEVQFESGHWDYPEVGVINVYDPFFNPLESLTNTTTGVNVTYITGNIGYIYFNSVGDGAGADIDNLAFSTDVNPIQIPAPGSILLGGIGLGLIGWLRRRRTL
jgi:hypothetical protein